MRFACSQLRGCAALSSDAAWEVLVLTLLTLPVNKVSQYVHRRASGCVSPCLLQDAHFLWGNSPNALWVAEILTDWAVVRSPPASDFFSRIGFFDERGEGVFV